MTKKKTQKEKRDIALGIFLILAAIATVSVLAWYLSMLIFVVGVVYVLKGVGV